MSNISISDMGNGILMLNSDALSLKTDTNRKIYVKKQKNDVFSKSYVFTGVELPHSLSREQKKKYLLELYDLCMNIKNSNQTERGIKNEENI